MAEFPIEKFREAIMKVVQLNRRFIPLMDQERPLHQASAVWKRCRVGVKPASEYTFIVFVTPVGPYFKGGIKPVNMLICRNYDRAAPRNRHF